jgi:fructokinase
VIQIGIDFGGTKIEAAALAEDGRFLARRRTPNPGSYDAAISVVTNLVQQIERDIGAQGTVGIGMPGSVSPRTNVLRNANTVWLNGRNFGGDVEQALQRSVRLANDANCLALSEAVDGAAAGARVVFAVIVGTGCGGGLVVDGRLIEGANGVGGEWGHMPLPWATDDELPGPPCWCGRRSCIETWVSGTGMARDHTARTSQQFTAEAIIARAREGDEQAVVTFNRYIDRLARALAVICDIVDPDTFVFGGGLSNVQELYQRLPAAIAPHVFADTWTATLVPALWGDSSGVRGAARLWNQP